MSAFLRAIENVDDVFVAPKLKDTFVIAMQKFHDYFEKNNLLDAFDIDKFFDMYLFKSTYPKLNKLKIKLDKYRELNGKPANYQGLFFQDRNTLNIKQTSKENEELLSAYKPKEEIYVETFIHEFIHFLTLYGRITLNENGKQVEKQPYRLYKHKGPKLTLQEQAFYRVVPLYEQLTESIANKIMGHDNPDAYEFIVGFVNGLNSLYNISGEKEFFKRNYKPYIKAIGQVNFNRYQNASYQIINSMSVLEKPERLHQTMRVMDSTLQQYYNLVKESMTATNFVDFQLKYYKNLGLRYEKEVLPIYNFWIDYGNQLFIENILEKNNIPYNETTSKGLRKLFIKAIGLKEAQQLAKRLGADFGVRVKVDNKVVLVLAKGSKLGIFNPNNHLAHRTKAFTVINKETSFKKADTMFYYSDTGQQIDAVFDKVKGKDYLNIIVAEGIKIKNGALQVEEEKMKKVEVSLKGNKIVLKGKSQEKEFSKQQIDNFLNNFDKIVEQEVEKTKELISLQKNVKERALTVLKPKPEQREKLNNEGQEASL